MYQSFVFVARRNPTPTEIHCLVTHLTNKTAIPVKTIRKGRIITLVSPVSGLIPKDVNLQTNAFLYKRTELVEPYAATEGDIATITTQLCYTINLTRPTRNLKGVIVKSINPVDHFGKIIDNTLTHYPDLKHLDIKEFFYAYIERQTGLRMSSATDVQTSKPLPDDFHSSACDDGHHVKFEGLIDLTVKARVCDPAIFNALAGASIGARRSYGFGSVYLQSLDSGASAPDAFEETEELSEAV